MSSELEQPIWRPSDTDVFKANMTSFMNYLFSQNIKTCTNYEELYDWSLNHSGMFWKTIWDFCNVIHSEAPTSILEGDDIRNAVWFRNARLNFAENLLRKNSNDIAIKYRSETQPTAYIRFSELHEKVAAFASALRKAGIVKGDRIAALITNRPEAIIGMLAASSIGAVWSSCSPDFGYQGVLDRFGQIKPKVLLTIDAYNYNGKVFDMLPTVSKLAESIPEIQKIVVVNSELQNYDLEITNAVCYTDFISDEYETLTFEQLPFDHPLYIMYSSGTTGKPKCIVHGAGGTLLQHLKELVLHTNLTEYDTITYFTTCGWMMWNWLVSSLAVGATLFLYDGSPSYPNLSVLFKAIEEEKISIFGTSPKFLASCESRHLVPKDKFDLSSLKTILSTGAPLSKQNFEYVYGSLKEDVQLASISGGTDIISCFMLGNPILPVYKGELQCRGLGMKVETYNSDGEPVVGEIGELVCTAPFPSRPICFWNDDNGEKYHKAYFSHFENVWRHGDYIEINEHGGCVVHGRSDATLNPGGVRIGTAEIYGPVESLPEIEESIVIGRKNNGDTEIILFIVLKEGYQLKDELKTKIKKTLKEQRSPRHIPSEIYQVSDIPRTLNGKKVEISVTKIIHNEEVSNRDAIANPESLEQFSKYRLKN